jgi:putative tricarboxylic transport membrane protein
MKRGDVAFSVICMGLSLWLILESQKFAYASKFGIGPGFFPFWLGITLCGFSLFTLISTLLKKNKTEDDEPRLPGWKSLLRVALIMAILAGFALSMKILGFMLTVFLFVSIILYALEGDGAVKSIFYGVMFSAAVFLVFQYWLEVDLPKGFLGV